MNRFEKSCIRSFFTLPDSIKSLPDAFEETIYARPFNPTLEGAGSITYKGTKYYITWFDFPENLEGEYVDLSFRDFSSYNMPPIVLIRKSLSTVNPSQPNRKK